jgi:alkyl hydroperoxide reductase subunit AhpC
LKGLAGRGQLGPDKRVKLTIRYPARTGRNFDEILRVVDSLQLTANYSVATPVNWKEGDYVIIVPAVTDEQARVIPEGMEGAEALPTCNPAGE